MVVVVAVLLLAANVAAPQGALDGGLNIPHNEKRFVGWTKEEGLEAEVRAAGAGAGAAGAVQLGTCAGGRRVVPRGGCAPCCRLTHHRRLLRTRTTSPPRC
jgi:hypothetical protein